MSYFLVKNSQPKKVVYMDGGKPPMVKVMSAHMRTGMWLLWLVTKYSFQTYGVLMLTLFGFYYYDYIELNDDLLMLSHICLLGSVICGVLFALHKALELE